MARYRKIDPRIWNDEKFRGLTDNGKLAFLFLLTHPHMTSLGAMRATLGGLGEELGWAPEAFREAFREASARGMAEVDAAARMIALPNFIRYNSPESPNVIKAWIGALDLLPECRLKALVIARARVFAEALGEAFAKALPEAFSKAMPYPEQEPEPEPKSIPPTAGASAPPDPDPIFGHGVHLLISKGIKEKSARSFLGLMRKSHGDAMVVEAIGKAEADDISDPVPWLRKYLESPSSKKSRHQPAPEDFASRDYGQGGKL
jgi:hypothetical protein